ncbi:MAG: hypothetical protein JSR60_06840 [Proteobacteria bacterium]|nr:hypothetical protein [Pseudomonadota bacterium]
MRLSRQLAVSLALAAMMLRALLPDGWMPATQAAGSPLVICSLDGIHTGGKTQPGQDERGHGPCAFAAMGHLSPPMQAALLPLPSEITQHFAANWTLAQAVLAPLYRANAARAPPAFS